MDKSIVFKEIVVPLMAVQEPYLVEAARVSELGQTVHGAVKDQRRVDGSAPAQVGDGGVFLGEACPAGIGQGIAAGVHGAAAGHRGQTFRIGVFRLVELQAVEHDDNGVVGHG